MLPEFFWGAMGGIRPPMGGNENNGWNREYELMICNLITVIDGREKYVIKASNLAVLQDVICVFLFLFFSSICQFFCKVLQNNIHSGIFSRS